MNLDLQSTQPVWLGVSNPRWSMGEGTSPLRLRTTSHKCQHALNSSTLNFVFSKSSTNSNVNGYEIDNLPIVLADKQHQTRLASLVDQILTAKNANPDRDVSELENEIDQIVYSSYGLTDDEIKIVEEA